MGCAHDLALRPRAGRRRDGSGKRGSRSRSLQRIVRSMRMGRWKFPSVIWPVAFRISPLPAGPASS
eukprot:2304076-Alexandrium_andersonii.AAC.1